MTTETGASGMAKLVQWLREPLSSFLLITLAIFAYDALREQPQEDSERLEVAAAMPADDLAEIVVSEELVAGLEDEFFWLQGRQPDAAEVQDLVSEWVRDEMIFRHALSQNLHRGDAKMREHLIEKLSLLWAGMPDEPDDVGMLGYYMDNIARYYAEPRVSFTQVFYEQLPPDAEDILARLNAGEQIAGEGYWMGDVMRDYGESIMRTSFGGEFYQALTAALPDAWIGPLESPRGYHFVRLDGTRDAAPLKFEQVYEQVRMDMMGAEQNRRIEEQLTRISSQFAVSREDIDG